LPVLAATLLQKGTYRIGNVPRLMDVATMMSLLDLLGARCVWEDEHTVGIDTTRVENHVAPYELVKKMRASVLVLGSLIGGLRKATVSYPGGCAIGERPIDLHLKGLAALHAQKIVHTDLKPANIELLEDPSIEAGYRVKLIDMDFTVLSDRKAPWHDDPSHNYVGTPNYFSPEHLSGVVPTEASDVFTAAVIVCEILARGGHPYAADDPEIYRTGVLAHVVRPKLLNRIPDADGATERLEAALYAALDPNPAARPTAADLHAALLGRPISIPAPPPLPPPPPREPDAPPHLGGNMPLRLVMQRDGGADVVVITATIDTTLGQGRLLGAGADARCWSSVQCRLIRHGEKWFLEPDSSARHATLLNGKTLTELAELRPDDEISVGDEKRAIKKLPMRVEIGEAVDA
ncbi:MAG TPA: protein kinase, partial [Acidobacteriota bacterium]|nr:protein kinase [Acidobacteriota bacterium]